MYSQSEANDFNLIDTLPTGLSLSHYMTRVNFATRKELIEAARVLNPADPNNQIVTNLSTVNGNARTRALNDTR